MGGVCHSPTRECHICTLAMDTSTSFCLFMDNSRSGDLTINDLELSAYVAHLHILALKTVPLEHIHTLINNTATEGWAQRDSISSATAVGPLLREVLWIMQQAHIHMSVERITRLDNKEADTFYRLTHFPVQNFLQHLRFNFPNPSAWILCLLMSAARQRLYIILHMQLSSKASPLPISTRTPNHGANETYSDNGSKSHPTSTISSTPCHYLKIIITSYVRESLHSRRKPFKSGVWSSTSAPWAKYLRPWRPQTLDLIDWAPSILVWDDNLRPTRENILLPT